jgi:hypothetical protein
MNSAYEKRFLSVLFVKRRVKRENIHPLEPTFFALAKGGRLNCQGLSFYLSGR